MQKKLCSFRLGGCALLLFGVLFSSNAFAKTLKEVAKFDLPGARMLVYEAVAR
jgi:hypothetical protein